MVEPWANSPELAWSAQRRRVFHKVAFFGPSEVGKTSLINALHGSKDPTTTRATVAAQYSLLHCKDRSDPLLTHEIGLWDTAGQERYSALTPIYLRNAELILVVVSVCTPVSALADLERRLGLLSYNPTPTILHVINKTDLLAQESELRELRSQLDDTPCGDLEEISGQAARRWLPTSAKSGAGVRGLLEAICEICAERKDPAKAGSAMHRARRRKAQDGLQDDNCC